MKFISLVFLFSILSFNLKAQGNLPESYLEGKSVVLISSDPSARPAMEWRSLADSIHPYLVESGGDPVGYFELEQISLSEATLAEFATALAQRKVKNVVFVTRQKNACQVHIGPFSGDAKVVSTTSIFGIKASDWKSAGLQLEGIGKQKQSKNLLVIDVAEFPLLNSTSNSGGAVGSLDFLPRNPLNLDVFKLGIPLEGTSAETGMVSFFRYDLLGKTQESILAEQATQKSQIQEIISQVYPHQVEWLTESRPAQELIRERVQFLLVKVEGRQADLMKSMGLDPLGGEEGSQTVVKYYIKLLVRDELYIGPVWDAHPDWRVALRQFLENLKK